MSHHVRRPFLMLGLAFLAIAGQPGAAAADQWGSYRWAPPANPFTLKLGDNVSSAWDAHLRSGASDWTASVVLDAKIVAGGTRRRSCDPTISRVEVCSARYGDTGWLGLTTIWLNGNDITQATIKVNDTYFETPKYDKSAWRNFVMCHEIGHSLGLDHRNDDFDDPNLGTCLDLTNRPKSNQHPNRRDFKDLKAIYAEPDETTTASAAPTEGPTLGNAEARTHTFVDELGDGRRLITMVIRDR